MDFLIVTTESHRELADQFFHPTLERVADVVVRERRLDQIGTGEFGSDSWQRGVTAKLLWVQQYLSTVDDGEMFVLSDVDIQFFTGFAVSELRRLLDEERNVDVLFQREYGSADQTEVNTGFYIGRNTPWLRELIKDAIASCERAEMMNDQTAINEQLKPEELNKKWGLLPHRYYARSQGFPPGHDIVLHHANFSGTIPEKVAQLKRVRKYVCGGPAERMSGTVGEGWDYVRSGKLRLALRKRFRRS